MEVENENYWLLDVDEVTYEKSFARTNSPDCESTSYESSAEDFGSYSYDSTSVYESHVDKAEFRSEPDDLSWDSYLHSIKGLNDSIEEFSKVIQTLALFKYYVKNRRSGVNITELNRRFNAICADCSLKIRAIQEQVKVINYENHYVMVNGKRLGMNYSLVRSRFNLQDSSVKKLRILIDTFNTVIREYTQISKKLTSSSSNSSNGSSSGGGSDADKRSLLSEIDSRSRDIQILEQNAKDLNELFAELNSIIKKRGDNISSLENQLLLSSEQIEKGKDDFDVLVTNSTHLQGLYVLCVCIAVGTFFLILPSNLKNIFFKKF